MTEEEMRSWEYEIGASTGQKMIQWRDSGKTFSDIIAYGGWGPSRENLRSMLNCTGYMSSLMETSTSALTAEELAVLLTATEEYLSVMADLLSTIGSDGTQNQVLLRSRFLKNIFLNYGKE